MKTLRAVEKILKEYFLALALAVFLLCLASLTAQYFFAAKLKIAPPRDYAGTNVLIGAGDIADCGAAGAMATAKLLGQNPGIIFTAGDNAQRDASLAFFNRCFGQSWGKYLERIRPALGNHDYETAGAAGYFDYFGDSAGDRGKGYYSYNIGSWHIVVLNSNCAEVGGCSENSPQGRWLKADLSADSSLCSLAYWHHPLFNSGNHSDDEAVKPFWNILYRAGAEIVMNGHAHDYERFSPQTPEGTRDDESGIREFVVGTGGYAYNDFGKTEKNSEIKNTGEFGVLKFELGSGEYKWQFIPVAGGKFTDSGRAACH